MVLKQVCSNPSLAVRLVETAKSQPLLDYCVWAVLTSECLGGCRPDPLGATGTLCVKWHIEKDSAVNLLSTVFPGP